MIEPQEIKEYYTGLYEIYSRDIHKLIYTSSHLRQRSLADPKRKASELSLR